MTGFYRFWRRAGHIAIGGARYRQNGLNSYSSLLAFDVYE